MPRAVGALPTSSPLHLERRPNSIPEQGVETQPSGGVESNHCSAIDVKDTGHESEHAQGTMGGHDAEVCHVEVED